MPITFDAATRGSDVSATSSTTSHTVANQSNRILFGACIGNVIASPDNVTGMSYAGVAMTLIDKSNGSGDRWQYLYYLLNPAIGANNFVITSSGAPNDIYGPTAISYYGVKQELPEVRQKTTGTSDGGKSENITTLTNGAWVVGMLHANVAVAAGAGTTERSSNVFYDKNAPVNPAGVASLALTWVGTKGWAYIMCSIAPASDSMPPPMWIF